MAGSISLSGALVSTVVDTMAMYLPAAATCTQIAPTIHQMRHAHFFV